jgi:hypothetical protein
MTADPNGTPTMTIDPLDPDSTTTFDMASRYAPGGTVQVPGCLITPGLAMVRAVKGHEKHPVRYSIMHTVSGQAIGSPACGVHVHESAKALMLIGQVDWLLPGAELAGVLRSRNAGELLATVGRRCNGRWCVPGDGPEPQSWWVSCKTCGWEWTEGDDGKEWPLSEEEARDLGLSHDCEPYVEVTAPDGTKHEA